MTDPYVLWLKGMLEDVPSNYNVLIDIAHHIEFVAIVPFDDNRADDGLALRREYEIEFGQPPRVIFEGPTLFEVMVGLARRMEFLDFEMDETRTYGHYFCILVENLEIGNVRDSEEVLDALITVVLREYDPDGRGGFFPLENPDSDQRNLQMWYQMQAFFM